MVSSISRFSRSGDHGIYLVQSCLHVPLKIWERTNLDVVEFGKDILGRNLAHLLNRVFLPVIRYNLVLQRH